jgi:very-short-patch-repair endonuclease
LHQTRSLPAEHTTVEARIPVTSLERTFLDTAARLDARQLEHDLIEADRSRRLRWSELWQILTEHGRGRRGVKRLKRVAAQADPQVNVLVEGKRVDFYWPKQRLVVEADSYGYHADRPAFERDHQSTVDLQVAGYRVLRTTYKMLQSNPRPFLSLVRDSLSA